MSKIIDFHSHVFPDKIAERSIEILKEKGGHLEAVINGTVGSLKKYMNENGIDKSVVLNIATNAKQQKNVNDFAASINNAELIAFGSVYPYAEDALDELERIADMGLKGIKLHPDYQEFYVDDPRLFPLYKKIASLKLVTVFHSGMDIGTFEPVHCEPEALSKALPYFDGTPVVAAHFGGYLKWYEVEKHLVGKDIYFDTAYCFSKMPFLHARRIVESHGAGKIVFGSDMPWSSAVNELRMVDSLGLSAEEKAMVTGGTAAAILGI